MEHIHIKVQTIQDQIESLKRDFGVIRAEVNNIREDLDHAKQTINDLEENIESEMEERIAKANQVFIRGAKTKESAENAIEIASNGQATPKWIKVIKRRGSNEHDEALGYVAEMQNRDEKTAILKGAKNLGTAKTAKISLSSQTKRRNNDSDTKSYKHNLKK